MELRNEFVVAAPVDATWELLMDVSRVVPCMPGAELVEVNGVDRWKARINVRLGPMAMRFETDVHREHVDEGSRNVRLVTIARESKGRGQAKATIASTLTRIHSSETKVAVVTDLALSGKIAQFGHGAVQDVAAELAERFTANLGAAINHPDQTGTAVSRPAPVNGGQPAGGIGILIGAFGHRMRRIWRDLLGAMRPRGS